MTWTQRPSRTQFILLALKLNFLKKKKGVLFCIENRKSFGDGDMWEEKEMKEYSCLF